MGARRGGGGGGLYAPVYSGLWGGGGATVGAHPSPNKSVSYFVAIYERLLVSLVGLLQDVFFYFFFVMEKNYHMLSLAKSARPSVRPSRRP